MPTTDSAEKRAKQNEKRRQQNRSWKSQVKNDRKAVTEALEDDKSEEDVQELVNQAISSIDRAVSKGVFHPNKGGRLKSQLHQKVNDKF